MSVASLLSQPLTVQPIAQGATDEYGNAVPGPAGPAVPELGYLEQRSSTEYLTDRDTTVTKWHAFLRHDTAVTALAFITFQGQTFQVDGAPWHVFNPRTRVVTHVECDLTVVS